MTQRLDVLVHPASMVVETCCNCGIFFAMPKDYQERRRFDGENFFCPVGHPQHYTTSEKTRLERALKEAQERADREELWHRNANSRAAALERSRNAIRGHLTRIRKRVGAGCCPACKRHFENLERHMESKHPGFADEEGGAR